MKQQFDDAEIKKVEELEIKSNEKILSYVDLASAAAEETLKKVRMPRYHE